MLGMRASKDNAEVAEAGQGVGIYGFNSSLHEVCVPVHQSTATLFERQVYRLSRLAESDILPISL